MKSQMGLQYYIPTRIHSQWGSKEVTKNSLAEFLPWAKGFAFKIVLIGSNVSVDFSMVSLCRNQRVYAEIGTVIKLCLLIV